MRGSKVCDIRIPVPMADVRTRCRTVPDVGVRRIPGGRLIAPLIMALVLGILPGVVTAQDFPSVTTEPTSGAAGIRVTLIGTGFAPGGYGGIIFWDGEPIDTFSIPDGGDFRTTFRVPIDSILDEHILSVCAAAQDGLGEFACFTGESAQRAETLFVVDAPAADPPALASDPSGGAAGAPIILIGSNFTPGGYEGLVFWDDEPVDRLTIPQGGDFRHPFQIPIDAGVGEHLVRVCAAEADSQGTLTCVSGDFAQDAEALVVVDAAVPIRLCKEEVVPCSPFTTATLYRTGDDKAFAVDEDGYVLERAELAAGDLVWARALNGTLPAYDVYSTSGDPRAVQDLDFDPELGEYRLALTVGSPLVLFNLDLSATWYVEGNDAYKQRLRDNLDKAARYFYQFTDGQMGLGRITVYQNLDNWDDADIRLYASNTLRPNAVIGGVVDAETPDIDPSLDVTYTPGTLDMGSAWNRYGVAPGQVVVDGGVSVDTSVLTDDWSVAFVHELGHYLLYLFDTYRDAAGVDSASIAAQCTGSAMGDVYQPANHAFVADANLWTINCGATEAYARHNGRTEWATITGWYDWLTIPENPARDNQLPVDVTSVTFVPPSQTPGNPLPTETVTLNYVDGETASGEARAFIYRDDRVIEQGKPIAGGNQLSLTGPEAGDMLCVYDVNDYGEAQGDSPRRQFGCETLAVGDTALQMTKNTGWRPVAILEQTASDTLRISVTQELPGDLVDSLTIRIYPEHATGLPPASLAVVDGANFGDDVVLPGPVPPLYVQLFVDETVAGLSTRRETLLDRGTGGGGLFGPVKKFGGVLVYSADGKATYQRDGDLDLAPGESLAWQSMVGVPPLPADRRIAGQAYRLDAFPASLVADGTVQIEFAADVDSQGATAAGVTDDPPAIHFFDGQSWQALDTTLGEPTTAAAGTKLALAPSQGVGIYAVLYESDPVPILKPVWLPLLRIP